MERRRFMDRWLRIRIDDSLNERDGKYVCVCEREKDREKMGSGCWNQGRMIVHGGIKYIMYIILM
jgi:hypothetical protein